MHFAIFGYRSGIDNDPPRIAGAAVATSAAGTKRPMQLFRQFIARVRAWRAARRALHTKPTEILPLIAFQTGIHREVTASGVRVYSLCGCCGARLEASATLCEECASRRSRLS